MDSEEEERSDDAAHTSLDEFILYYLESHDTIQPSDIVNMVSQSKRTISTHLVSMGNRGLLERAPSARGYIIWRLAEEPVRRRVSFLCAGFEKDLEDELCVPLRAVVSGGENGLLEELVDGWLGSDGRLLVLLGDYGCGKTVFSKQMYIRLARKYLEDPSSNRLPVLVQLKRLRSEGDPLACMTNRGHLYGAVPSNEELHKLNSEGKVVFILDGFDEMPISTGSSTPHRNFLLLNKLFTTESKVVLTSRTAYFKKQVEEQKVCNVKDSQSTGFLYEANREHNTIAYIQDLNSNDIDDYLRLCFGKNWKRKRTKMDNVYDLSDLAKRPILLNVICQTLPKLAKRDVEISPLEIYATYVDMWLEREKWKDINEDDVRQFMMELALHMSKTGNYELHYKELKRLISKSLSDRLFSYNDLEDFDLKVRACTFLHRDPEGNYSFIHRSFMEYFVALGVREVLETGGDIEQLEKVLSGVQLSGAVGQFLKDMQKQCPDLRGWLLVGSILSGNP